MKSSLRPMARRAPRAQSARKASRQFHRSSGAYSAHPANSGIWGGSVDRGGRRL